MTLCRLESWNGLRMATFSQLPAQKKLHKDVVGFTDNTEKDTIVKRQKNSKMVIMFISSPGSRSNWYRHWEVFKVTTTTRCLRMSSFWGIWKVECVLEIKQYWCTTGWTVFTQRFLKYTLEKKKRSYLLMKHRYTTLLTCHQLSFY